MSAWIPVVGIFDVFILIGGIVFGYWVRPKVEKFLR